MKTPIHPFLLAILFTACGNQSVPDERLGLSSAIAGQTGSDTTINFENDEIGKRPAGFILSHTGKPQRSDWQIVNDNGNKVAAQLAKNEGNIYNLLVFDNHIYGNFKMSVRIKAVAGDEDQGGGLVWRLIDNNNYYIVRLNPLENNLRFYKVENGNRRQLQSVETAVKPGEWFTMTVEMNGDKIVCSINGGSKISITDDTYKKGGRIGLWSKADAQTYFDDLTVHGIN
jgi:hypothetical protein